MPYCTMVGEMRSPCVLVLVGCLIPRGIPAESFADKVVGISDSETIRVMHEGPAEPIRLHAIDRPDSHQPFGTRLKQCTSDLAFGKLVTVQLKHIDRHARTVGEVIMLDGRSWNLEPITPGLACLDREDLIPQ